MPALSRRAARRTASAAASLILVLFLFPAGCSDDAGGPEPSNPLAGFVPDGTGFLPNERVALPGLTIAGDATAAERLRYRIEARVPGAEETVTLPVVFDAGGEAWFPAPFHSEDALEGGALELRLTDGESWSPAVAVSVQPLPEAPGRFAEIVARLRNLLEMELAALGLEEADLSGDSYAALPDPLVPLAGALGMLDDEANPYRLAAIAAGEVTEGPNGEVFDLEELDRVLAHLDLDDVLAAAEVTLSGLLAEGAEKAVLAPFPLEGGIPEISTPADLDLAMRWARDSSAFGDPNSTESVFLGQFGQGLSVLGLLPGAGGVTFAAGLATWSYTTIRQYFANVWPSEFEWMSFDYTKPVFLEDEEVHGTWDNVTVQARSGTWAVDGALFDTFFMGLDLTLQGLDTGELIGAMAPPLGPGMGQANAKLNQRIQDSGGTMIVGPNRWQVTLWGIDYVQAMSTTGRHEVDQSTQNYWPRAVGQDELLIRTQNDKFGGAFVDERKPVETKAIQVVTTPAEIRVEQAGQPVVISADIRNAIDTKLEWDPGAGEWADGGYQTNGPAVRTLDTPTDESLYPFSVRVTSLSTGGLRASGEPERFDTTFVRNDETAYVVVDPPGVCVEPNEQQQFTAEVVGREDQSVTWSSDIGSITQGGLFTAPSTPYTVATITATTVEEEQKSGSVFAVVSSCVCSWFANVSGEAVWSSAGPDAWVWPLGDSAMNFFFEEAEDDGTEGGTVTAAIQTVEGQPLPRPGDSGSYRCSVTFIPEGGGTAYRSSQVVDDIPEAITTLTIESWNDPFITGTITGGAVRTDENGDVVGTIEVDIRFKAGVFDGETFPCQGK